MVTSHLPFGEELFANTGGRTAAQGYVNDSVRQQFTSYERDDETGLDYAQARYYSNIQGRFISPDLPLVDQRPVSPQSWNLYSYVQNNPCNNVDPSGRCSAPAGLSAGQVGICIEAFIAAPRIGPGGIGYGDGRSIKGDGNNADLTSRMQVQTILTANKEGVFADTNVKVGVSTAMTGIAVDTQTMQARERTISLTGAADAKVSGQWTRPVGSEDFGTTTLNITGTAQNGFQATGGDLLGTGLGPAGAVLPIVGAAMIMTSPAGTIDFSVNFRITGNGQVEFTGGESRGYPTYAAYSYQNVNGNIVTTERFVVPENKIEDLTKPMRPIPK